MYRLIGSRPWCARCAGRHDRRGPTITDPDRDAAGGLPLWPSGAGNGAETPHTGQSPALARRNALRRPSSALLTAGRQVPRPCERRPRTVRPARGIPARQDHHSCCFLRRRIAQDVFGSGQPDGTAISANSLSSDAQGFEPYDPPCSSWKPAPPRGRRRYDHCRIEVFKNAVTPSCSTRSAGSDSRRPETRTDNRPCDRHSAPKEHTKRQRARPCCAQVLPQWRGRLPSHERPKVLLCRVCA
jgi:hypothetical protein